MSNSTTTRHLSTTTEDSIVAADERAAGADAHPTQSTDDSPDTGQPAADTTSIDDTDRDGVDGPADATASAELAGRAPEITGTFARIRRWQWNRILTFGVLPALALALGISAGYLKWQEGSARQAETDGQQAATSAAESAIAMLSYRADSVEHDLTGAEERLTGDFRNSYAALIHDVVIPGSKEKHISSQAKVPAAATISVHGANAEVLIFVDQSVTIGDDPPTDTASCVKLTLQKVQGRWLIAQFDPV